MIIWVFTPSRTKLRSFAYVIALIWLFLWSWARTNTWEIHFFGEPGAGYEAWILKNTIYYGGTS